MVEFPEKITTEISDALVDVNPKITEIESKLEMLETMINETVDKLEELEANQGEAGGMGMESFSSPMNTAGGGMPMPKSGVASMNGTGSVE